MKGNKIAITIASVGALLLGLAAVLAIGEVRYLSTARHASGLIVDMQSASGSSQPVVRFTAAGGAEVEFQSNFSSSYYQIGQEVSVAYDPADPKGTATIDDPVGDYLVSIVTGVFGVIALLLGLGLLGVLHMPQGAPSLRMPQGLPSLRMPHLSPKLIAPILLLIGVLLAGAALNAVNSALGWQPSTADGVVTDFSVDGDSNQYPVVRFTSADGRLHTFTSNTGSNPTPYHVGQQVTVYYDSTDPGRADLDRLGGAGLLALVLGAFAAASFLFAAVTRYLFAGGGFGPERMPLPAATARHRRRHRKAGQGP